MSSRSGTFRVVLVCLAIGTACSSRSSTDKTLDSDGPAIAERSSMRTARTPAEQDSLLRATFEAASGLRRSRAAVIERMGRPARIVLNPIESTHVIGQTDTIVSLRYETLSATFWVPGESTAGDLLVDLAIQPPWPLDVDVPPSADRRDLVGLWNRPALVGSAADTVILNWNVWDDDAEEYLQAYLVADELRKLRWSFYVD